jgi:hypothetical protein
MKRIAAGATALVAILTGCSSGDGVAPGGDGPLTQAEVQIISDEMQGELTAIVQGASVTDLLVSDFAPLPGAVRAHHGPIRFRPHDEDCPTFSEPLPPADDDGDGVPNNLTLTFDPALCTWVSERGNATHELSGSITISDPSTEDRGFRLSWGDFQARTTVDETKYFLRRINGVWQQVKSPTGFSLTDQTTVTHESSQFPAAVLAKDWQVDFVVDPGVTFSNQRGLPSGTLTVNGSTERTRNELTRSLTVETVVPLHFNSLCTEWPKIDAGELNIVHVTPNRTTTINIVFTGCGAEPSTNLVTGPTAS